MTWMPIESAPLDGTHILVFDGENVTSAYYVAEQREREIFVKSTKEGDIYRREKYIDGYWCPHRIETTWIFTHWMPLPEKPTNNRDANND